MTPPANANGHLAAPRPRPRPPLAPTPRITYPAKAAEPPPAPVVRRRAYEFGQPRGGNAVRAYQKVAPPEPRNLDEFAARIEEDVIFGFGLLVIASVIGGSQASVSNPSDDPRAEALAHNLTEKFLASIPNAMKAFGRGRAAFEVVAEWNEEQKIHEVCSLDYLEYPDSKLRAAPDGSVEGIDLLVGGKNKEERETVKLSSLQSWWFALDATPKYQHGRSRFAGAPTVVWKERRKLDGNYATWMDKFALGHGVIKAPSVYPANTKNSSSPFSDTNLGGTPADPIEDAEKMAHIVRSGGCVALPSEHHPPEKGGGPMWDYVAPAGQQDSGPLDKRQTALDAAALRSIGVPERAVTQDAATGSYAMAETHSDYLLATCEGILSQLVASYQLQVVEPFEKLNCPPGKKWGLTLLWQKLDPGLASLATEIVKGMIASPTTSPLVAHGIVDVGKLLEIARIPVGDNLPARLAAMQKDAQAQAGPGGGMGGAPPGPGGLPLGGPGGPPMAPGDDGGAGGPPGGPDALNGGLGPLGSAPGGAFGRAGRPEARFVLFPRSDGGVEFGWKYTSSTGKTEYASDIRKVPKASRGSAKPTGRDAVQANIKAGAKVAGAAAKVAGKGILKGAVAAGKGLKAAEHAVAHRVDQAVSKLPPKTQKVVRGIYHAAMATYNAPQKAAMAIAIKGGASPEQAKNVAHYVGIADIVLAKAGYFALEHGLHWGVAAASGGASIPLASLGYLAYSAGRNPKATLKAAHKVVGMIRAGAGKAGAAVRGALARKPRPTAAAAFARLFGRGAPGWHAELAKLAAGANGDWLLAVAAAALDADPKHDPENMLDVVRAAAKSHPNPPAAASAAGGSMARGDGTAFLFGWTYTNKKGHKAWVSSSAEVPHYAKGSAKPTGRAAAEAGAGLGEQGAAEYKGAPVVGASYVHGKLGKYKVVGKTDNTYTLQYEGGGKTKHSAEGGKTTKVGVGFLDKAHAAGTHVPAHFAGAEEIAQGVSKKLKKPEAGAPVESKLKVGDSFEHPKLGQYTIMKSTGENYVLKYTSGKGAQTKALGGGGAYVYKHLLEDAIAKGQHKPLTPGAEESAAKVSAGAAAPKPAEPVHTPPTPEPAAEPVHAPAEPEHPAAPAGFPDQLSHLTKGETLGGSTGARQMLDGAGNKFVLKAADNEDKGGHVKSEHHANNVYRAIGLAVPDGKLYVGSGGHPALLSKWVDGKDLGEWEKTATPAQKKAAYAEIGKGFAADALLANWDVVGLSKDNIKVAPDGSVHRIDNGGSFSYKAQGATKPLGYGSAVGELTSMRDPSYSAGEVFGHLSDADVADQIGVLAKNRAAIIAAAPDHLKAVLGDRLDYMEKWAAAAKKKDAEANAAKQAGAKPSFAYKIAAKLGWKTAAASAPAAAAPAAAPAAAVSAPAAIPGEAAAEKAVAENLPGKKHWLQDEWKSPLAAKMPDYDAKKKLVIDTYVNAINAAGLQPGSPFRLDSLFKQAKDENPAITEPEFHAILVQLAKKGDGTLGKPNDWGGMKTPPPTGALVDASGGVVLSAVIKQNIPTGTVPIPVDAEMPKFTPHPDVPLFATVEPPSKEAEKVLHPFGKKRSSAKTVKPSELPEYEDAVNSLHAGGYGGGGGYTNEAYKAMKEYTSGGYRPMNQALRNGGAGGDLWMKTAYAGKIAALSGALKEAGDLPRPTLVYRGMDDRHLPELVESIKTGQPIAVNGFNSTSIMPGKAVQFAIQNGKRGMIFEIAAKTGMYVEPHTSVDGEHEIIQDKGTTYRVVAIHPKQEYSSHPGTPLTVVQLEEVGPEHYNLAKKLSRETWADG